MEDRVASAALAMVQPTTDPVSRREASRFLEEWTKTPGALEIYTKWLASYRQQEKSLPVEHQIPMQMLCLTMLQSRLRQERFESPSSSMGALRVELWEYLRQPNLDRSLVGPCCICNAITIVRSDAGRGLTEFLTNARNNTVGLPPEITLRLLGCIPAEVEARQALTTAQVREVLQQHLEVALDLIGTGMAGGKDPTSVLFLYACQALNAWIEPAQVSLTQINTPTCGGSIALLPVLLKILSSTDTNIDEVRLQTASRALTAAIGVTTDIGTPTRQAAAASFWMAIPREGFLTNPLRITIANQWNDAGHALASLLSTFLVEHAEDIVGQPADAGLQLLLDIQSHPSMSVALIPLECWLTIQEIPTAERHEHWKKPLFRNLLEIFLRRMAYPANFTTWENEFEVDSSDFTEFRRMVGDVLVSCYYLLRVEMIQLLTHQIRTASDWRASEVALFALAQISKDTCARCRSHAPNGTLVARDRQSTQQELLRLLEQLMAVDAQTASAQHNYLLGAVVNFCGNYSPAWNSMECPPQAILQLLTYLQSAFVAIPLEAAKATRAIYVSCLAKTMSTLEDVYSSSTNTMTGNETNSASSFLPLTLKSVKNSIEAALSTTDEEAMTTVAEGATRLITKLGNPEIARQALTNDLINPVINRIDAALQTLPQSHRTEEWMALSVQSATESLSRYLAVIRTISRFCDAPHIPAIGEWMLHMIDPCLKIVHERTISTPAQPLILTKWIAIHQQILRKTLPQPSITISIFLNTIPLIVQALEQTRDPGTLRYIATAVEVFGGQTDEMDKSFQDLLVHVTTEITRQTDLSEAVDLIQSYFECLQRFILYCPRALCFSSKLSDIVNIAVGTVSVLDAKDSTRAALVFVSQLFGWNYLRLSNQTTQVMQEAWNALVLKELILRYGQNLIQACFVGLSGGSQMLWPAYSDCIFAIVQAVMRNERDSGTTPTNPADTVSPRLNESLVKQWLFSSIASTATSNNSSDTRNGAGVEVSNQIIPILLTLAQDGSKSRPKAKMLLIDYAKIRKGEMTVESLLSYSLS